MTKVAPALFAFQCNLCGQQLGRAIGTEQLLARIPNFDHALRARAEKKGKEEQLRLL